MKRNILTVILTLLITSGSIFAQYELRNLPYYVDVDWQNKPVDYVWGIHLKPVKIPDEAYKIKPGPPRIQSQSGIELINISPNANLAQSETYIVVNPLDPTNIVVGANDYRYFNLSQGYKMVVFYSTDAGETWTESATPRTSDFGLVNCDGVNCTSVDPGLGFNSKGQVFYAYLLAQLLEENVSDNGIFVSMSRDKGKTWEDDDLGYAILVNAGALQDKCFIAVDSDPNSPFADRAYVTWFDTQYPFSIGFAYSEDGLEYNTPSKVKGSDKGMVQSPLPVVGPDGVLYISWRSSDASTTSAMVQKSTDGGVSWAWGSPKTVQRVNTSGTKIGSRLALGDKQDMRVSSFPSMDVDMRNGNLYLVQSGKDKNGKYGVFMSKSFDGGETWTGAYDIEKLIKIDGNTFGNDVFMPSITVDPITGMIAVLYYSSENDTENNKGCDAFVAVSFDEGETFKHIQLTDTWYFKSGSVVNAGGDDLGRYWGDYTSIDAYNGKIYPCFWMPTAANSNFHSLDLFTAKLSTGPEAPTELTADNPIDEPNKVILNWVDPTNNKLGGPIEDFMVYIFRDNNKIGEVNKGVETFTDNDAINGESYVYSIRTQELSSGNESEFVNVTVNVGGVLEPRLLVNIIPRSVENGILLSWDNPDEHIDGTYLGDLESVLIYIDDVLFSTVSRPDIQAGEGSRTLLELATESFYKLKIKVTTKRGDNTGESPFTEEMIVYAGSPLDILSENFDNPQDMTPNYVNEGWAITEAISKSPPSCLTDSPDGDYDNNVMNNIIFPPTIIIPGAATLALDHIALVHSKDIAKIKVSKDFGNSFKSIIWLNVKRYEGWDNSGYDINESEWFRDGIDLSEFEGDTIMIMFELETNQFNTKDGWYIDNLQIGDYPVGVENLSNLKNELNVSIYPNPTKGETQIDFTLPVAANTMIAIYDALGKKVLDIEQSFLQPGYYSYPLNLLDLSNGFYYCRLSVNNSTEIKPIIINK